MWSGFPWKNRLLSECRFQLWASTESSKRKLALQSDAQERSITYCRWYIDGGWYHQADKRCDFNTIFPLSDLRFRWLVPYCCSLQFQQDERHVTCLGWPAPSNILTIKNQPRKAELIATPDQRDKMRIVLRKLEFSLLAITASRKNSESSVRPIHHVTQHSLNILV